MGQTREAITQPRAERWGGQVARREEARGAQRLERTPVVDGVYRLDEGALLEGFCQFGRELGVLDLMEGVQGTALPREMVPVVQDLWRDGLKTLWGSDRMQALPAWRCSDEARRPVVGVTAQQGRQGVCQRGVATRQRPRPEGPLCPETLAHHLVPRHLRALEAWCNGTRRALATAGLVGAKVTGMVEATDLDTTAASEGRGQATR